MKDEVPAKPGVSLRPLGVVLVVAAAPFLVAMAWECVAFLATVACGLPSVSPGPMARVRDWPGPLQELHAELRAGSDFEAFLLYGTPGEFSVQTAVFRLDASEALLSQVVQRLELVPVEKQRVDEWGDFVVAAASTAWWATAKEVKCFQSQSMLDGEEGDLYVAVYDPLDRRLYLVYEFNF